MYVLASQSPRRREILKYIIPEFESVVSGCEEVVPEGTDITDIPRILAEQKAEAVAKDRPDDIVIGSDTVVILDGKIYGKPKDEEDAKRMLRLLSGRTHTVYTGVAVCEKGVTRSFKVHTDVLFYDLSEETIDWYVKTGDPMDKAGAYGIQGIGCVVVKEVHGDYFTVMGFPLAETARFLGLVK